MTDPDLRAVADAVTRKLIDEGRLVEAGWQGLRILSVPDDAPPLQLYEMRNAFFAGAQHVFSSFLSVLEPGEEPTDNDLRRLSLIQAELDAFGDDLRARIVKPPRRAEPPKPEPDRVEQFEQQASPDKLGDAPVDEEFHQKMRVVIQTVDEFFNDDKKGAEREIGVLLLVTPFAQGGRLNFMSNGLDRRDVVTMFKEMIARFEGQPEVTGSA